MENGQCNGRRLRFIYEYDVGAESMRELCQCYGIARETGYVWLRRYRVGGLEGLREHSRAVQRNHNQTKTPEELEQLVLELRQAESKCVRNAPGLKCQACPRPFKCARHSADVVATCRSLRATAVFACLLSILINPVAARSQAQSANSPATSTTASRPAADTGPSQPDPQLVQTKALLDQGEIPDAERSVREYLQTHGNSAEAHFLLGYILFREIQARAATSANATPETYREPGTAAPDTAFEDTNAKASLAEFTEGAKYHTPSAFDLKIVALDYVVLNDFVDADKWLSRSLQWNPKDADSWYNLGRAKYNENRFDEAAQCFEQVLKLEPKNVRAEDNLGLAYLGLGKTDAAIAAYQTAIAWQSDLVIKSAGPYLNLGILLMEQNRPQDAVPYFVQAIAIAPKESRHHEELGKAYTRLDETKKAQAELETAVSLSPQNSRLHYLLGRVYSKEGLTDKANAEFSRSESLKAAQSAPASPPAP